MPVSTHNDASIVGRVVDGRYRVLRHLANGGMASVFVALDQRLDREVALKVMRPDLAHDEAFVARFRREARAAARLSHPNIVAVTDQGSDEHYVFLAMELVQGRTLRQLMRDAGPLSVQDALNLMDPVLDGLSAAHRAGFVHRDIKPENVLIRDDGVVKVTDFGLARAVTTSTLTGDSDILLGTAAYLSPEQVDRGTADARSDVYAAGLLLYEMLVGRKAFPGDSPIHVAYQHVHGEMPLVADARDDVPTEVDDLIATATAKDPDDRPSTAADLLVGLRSARRTLGLPAESTTVPMALLDASPAPADAASDEAEDGAETTSHTASVTSRTNPLDNVAPPPEPPQRRRRRPLAILAVALLLVVALVGWGLTLGPFGPTTVPNVAGTAQGAALEKIQQANLRTSVSETFSEDVPKGRVVATHPSGGDDLRKQSTVEVLVSKGPERFTVPVVGGKTLAQARAALGKASLEAGDVTREYDEKVPEGKIVSSSPAAGSPQRKGTSVDLVVSKGPEPITIPDVSGETEEDATSALEDLGFEVKTGTPVHHDSIPKGSVVSTSPAISETATKGDTITIVLSKGPEMVTVPNVVDKKADDAKRTLEALGFEVKLSRFFGGIFNQVRDQSIKAGTSVRKGSTITLSVV